MPVSRRDFTRLVAGGGALAAFGQLGRSASVAQTLPAYRAMVGVFLFGGNDAWNMVVPTGSRYADYAARRGKTLALPESSLVPLTGTPYGLHPSFAPLKSAWSEGALSVMLNTGTLFQPLTKTLYQTRPDLRPLNIGSHADEQNHWQGNRAREPNLDGFMGRIYDRINSIATLPQVMSFGGSSLALIGKASSPLILSSSGTLVRNGYNAAATDTATRARQSALDAFAADTADGAMTQVTATGLSSAYAQAVFANGFLTSTTSKVDAFFVDPATGKPMASDISRQLARTARMIEARQTLGHDRQVFFLSQGGYDTHADQVLAGATDKGRQAGLYADLAQALAAFYQAMKSLGVRNDVTTFTMSDFGRAFQVNAQIGTDHAWGNNHLVLGGALAPQTVHGTYPDLTFGGPDDASSNGRWIPSTATEEYIGAVAAWSGVAAADMPYVFPNWSTWSTGGRGPVPLFKS